MKCENCKREGQAMININNYVVTYKSWEAFNCCCEDCARQCANRDGIDNEEIENIE